MQARAFSPRMFLQFISTCIRSDTRGPNSAAKSFFLIVALYHALQRRKERKHERKETTRQIRVVKRHNSSYFFSLFLVSPSTLCTSPTKAVLSNIHKFFPTTRRITQKEAIAATSTRETALLPSQLHLVRGFFPAVLFYTVLCTLIVLEGIHFVNTLTHIPFSSLTCSHLEFHGSPAYTCTFGLSAASCTFAYFFLSSFLFVPFLTLFLHTSGCSFISFGFSVALILSAFLVLRDSASKHFPVVISSLCAFLFFFSRCCCSGLKC